MTTYSPSQLVTLSSRATKSKLNALPPEKSFDHPYPTCTLPTDSFHLPTINTIVPLSFAYCRPSKFSVDTLGPSGSILGLAPSEHLRQTGSTSLLKQLLAKGIIERPIFSLMLINGEQGVLSIGGTGARAVDLVEQQTKDELDYISAAEGGTSPSDHRLALVPRGMTKRILETRSDWEDGWKWSKVQGAEGWWQILMHGVWVDGSKVLQNQAAVIDVCSQPCFSNSSQMLFYTFQLNLDIEFLKIDKQPFHHCAPSRSQSFLRFHLRLSTAPPSLFKLLQLPMPQPTEAAF